MYRTVTNMPNYTINHTIYTEETDREVELTLNIHCTPFRKGDSVDAWYGPTPDEPAECELEEIWLGHILLPLHHRFYDAIDGDELMELVDDYCESLGPHY